jgi:hypothetical protein
METGMPVVGRWMTTKAVSIWTGACLAGLVLRVVSPTPLPTSSRLAARGARLSTTLTAASGPAAAERAHLEGAVLMQARLTGADLRGAAPGGAYLNAAHLAGAHLEQADLAGADLAAACLVGADLRGANLASARLTGANLDGAVLAGAVYDEGTQWPAGFRPAQHGAQPAALGLQFRRLGPEVVAPFLPFAYSPTGLTPDNCGHHESRIPLYPGRSARYRGGARSWYART